MSTQKKTFLNVSYFLALWSAMSLGALSFIGMLVITSSWPWSIAAFFLASLIEGEIFKENILKAMDNLFEKGPIAALKRAIAQRELSKHDSYKKALRANRRAMEEDYIRDHVHQPDFAAEVKRKSYALILSSILSVGAGISAGLATLSAASIGLTTLGTTAWLAFASACPIAFFSAIGYSLMMYKGLADMVQNDKLHRAVDGIREFFTAKPGETTKDRFIRCVPAAIGVSAVVGLAAFATIATAGTWWFAAKKGASLMGLSDKNASLIRTATVAAMAPATFIFNADNALESASQISGGTTKNAYVKLKHFYFSPLQGKNLLQKMNPLYWLGKTAELAILGGIFVGHLIAVGLTSDGLSGVDPKISTAGGTLVEFLTDWHYVFELEHEHKHDHAHQHDDHEEEDDHYYGNSHHHHHSNLPTLFTALVLAPVGLVTRWLDKGLGWLGNKFGLSKDHIHVHDQHEHCHHESSCGSSTAATFTQLKMDGRDMMMSQDHKADDPAPGKSSPQKTITHRHHQTNSSYCSDSHSNSCLRPI